MRFFRPMILTAALASLPLAASAGPLRDRPRAGNGPMAEERREKVLDMVETIRIAKLTEALALDPATAEKFFPAQQPFAERRKTAMKERLEAMRSMKKELDSDAPDAKHVGDLLDQVMSNRQTFAQIEKDEHEALKKVLDPIRLAKYYKFQLEFEQKIGQQIRQIRQERNGGGERPFRNRDE